MLGIWQNCPVTNSLAPDDQISLRAKGKQPNPQWRCQLSPEGQQQYPKLRDTGGAVVGESRDGVF